MKTMTMGSGVICLLANFGLGVMLLAESWRVGIGNRFMKDLLLKAHADVLSTYEYRYYGLMWIKGVHRFSWRVLAQSTCDKWVAIYGLSVIEGLAVEGGTCISNAVDGNDCPDNFANHMMHRCTEYANMSQAQNVVLSTTALCLFSTMGSCMLLMLGSVKNNRDLIFSMLVFGNVCCFVGLLWYVWISDKGFKILGEGATYPYPQVGWTFYGYVSCAAIHLAGAMLFGWTKIFQKWIFGANRPEGWVPPNQRGLPMPMPMMPMGMPAGPPSGYGPPPGYGGGPPQSYGKGGGRGGPQTAPPMSYGGGGYGKGAGRGGPQSYGGGGYGAAAPPTPSYNYSY